MKDILEYLKARPLLAIAIGIGILFVLVLALWLGAHLWQAILAAFGVGAGASQPLKLYAQKDKERTQDLADIEAAKVKKFAELDQTRMRDERAIRVELGKTTSELDEAIVTETPEQFRQRLLDMSKGPLQCLLLGALSLSGCATTNGAPSGVQRDVCFTKQEAGDILKRVAVLQALVKQCKSTAAHDQAKAAVECQASVAKWQLESRICSDKLVACSARKCSSCWLPWVIVGVSLTATAAVGIYAGVKLQQVGRY